VPPASAIPSPPRTTHRSLTSLTYRRSRDARSPSRFACRRAADHRCFYVCQAARALVLAFELAGEEEVEEGERAEVVACAFFDECGECLRRILEAQGPQLVHDRVEGAGPGATTGRAVRLRVGARRLGSRSGRSGRPGRHGSALASRSRYCASGRATASGAGRHAACGIAASCKCARRPRGVGARTVAVLSPS